MESSFRVDAMAREILAPLAALPGVVKVDRLRNTLYLRTGNPRALVSVDLGTGLVKCDALSPEDAEAVADTVRDVEAILAPLRANGLPDYPETPDAREAAFRGAGIGRLPGVVNVSRWRPRDGMFDRLYVNVSIAGHDAAPFICLLTGTVSRDRKVPAFAQADILAALRALVAPFQPPAPELPVEEAPTRTKAERLADRRARDKAAREAEKERAKVLKYRTP